mgnify:CR=1 FL=1|tara:strand:- start:923 stop:1210 length:288 start_codon:yes stop_codon:yes gene_type:complete
MQLLLLIERCRQAVPESASHQEAKHPDNDCIGLGAAPLRLIKAWTAVEDAFVSHEQTRERAHAQQYAVTGIPCQRFFLLFFLFLGLLVTLFTAST